MVNQGQTGMARMNSSNDQNRKIFLGGLHYDTTDDNLRAYCSKFGEFTDCLVMRTPEGRSRGFGFVTYEDAASVDDFMRNRPHQLDGRQIDAKRAMPREDQNRSEAHLKVTKLFVAGLRNDIDRKALEDHFSQFGEVTDVLIMTDGEGKYRGFGFVSFKDYDDADKAILAKPHVINGRQLDIKKAIPKDKMNDIGSRPPSTRHSMGQGPARTNYSDNSYSDPWSNSNPAMPPSYSQHGYNNPSINANPYPASYSTSMSQNPPPSSAQSMMNYDTFNNPNNNSFNSSMPYKNTNSSNYMSSSSYGANQASAYASAPSPAPPLPPSSGFNDGTTSTSASNSYGMMAQHYSDSYHPMTRGSGGPMRDSRGYGGNHSNYNSRPAPYANLRGGAGRGRGRGRGH